MNNNASDRAAAWITVEDAARLLRRSPWSVHSYAEAGRLQVQTRGRRHLFLRAEVKALAARLPADDARREPAADPPASPDPDTLVPMFHTLHAEIDDLRQRLVELNGVNRGTQILVAGVEAELARRADWPTELDLRAALVQVTAERDWLRGGVVAQHRWSYAVGTTLMIVGALMLLAMALALVWRGAVG